MHASQRNYLEFRDARHCNQKCTSCIDDLRNYTDTADVLLQLGLRLLNVDLEKLADIAKLRVTNWRIRPISTEMESGSARRICRVISSSSSWRELMASMTEGAWRQDARWTVRFPISVRSSSDRCRVRASLLSVIRKRSFLNIGRQLWAATSSSAPEACAFR